MPGFCYLLDDLCRLATDYCAATKTSHSTLGREACDNTMVIGRILAGKGCNARMSEALTLYLDKHWPADLPWPGGVPRNRRARLRRARRALPRGEGSGGKLGSIAPAVSSA